ncbi:MULTISPECIES: SDR family NAD(P)-dependent oxidoreductase [unclassified Cryobacterium]|uniref:SDR family NAD(P)-dependent oxidoreductase n=1 Tax=unclassified Cryobacterium TaxID=2649013 RepID=UPI00106BB775|nr:MULTISPECIES: SDR family oxidoreductase [unclassified Cryobacterium]TFD09405.1 SDR family oxidoreductase [Cryobacterium sp. TMT1-66-1]TFD11870.1 SDR family oxidoreductase [Cryobacterium sp. TMT1-2-2]
MTQLLENKTALITGGGVGIGREIALQFADSGARIAVTYRTHAPDDDFVNRIEAATGSPLVAVGLEATDESAVQAALGLINRDLGGLDILVNNVGGLVQRSSIGEMSFELWRTVMATNLDSTFLATHYAMPFIRDGGRIINVASLAGINGAHSGATAYAASKAAMFGFTRGLAKEVAPRNITVNALAPGFIEATPFHDTFTTAESKRVTLSTIPLQRAGIPADVAGPALWLASELSAFVTGTTVNINGGAYFA